ncbi:hypothetical protein RJ639_011513 [Escallonia herrerae]|uniref:Retrotransposon gag domain-containing protein n=1 Tax=Escallonia herrerae TaxID=1293975 RepID=A0AA89ANG6_9ASTE|nr:hypothetical protein RJ639_011513 [Escallonia herrerae]
MLLLQVSDVVMYRAFPTTLRKAAHAWFKSLQLRSIYSFGQLSDLFQKHFVSSRSRRKNSASLLNIVQEKNESLAYFLGRFNAATLEIDNLVESVKYTAFLRGHRPTSKFAFYVNKSLPAIEALIKHGQLRKFVAPRDGRQQTPPAMEEREDREKNAGTINTISRGLAARGSTGRTRKAYAREVCITSQPPNNKSKTVPIAAITFSDKDSKDIKTPHDDPLVIAIKAGNFDVKRVLIDNGSSAEILFYKAFKKMKIPTDHLGKMDTPLYGFSNHPVAAKVLNQLQAVVSTYHLKMKFPTEHGIGEVKGDRTTARQCYVTSCRSKNKAALIIEDLREDTKMQRGEPVENLLEVSNSKTAMIMLSPNWEGPCRVIKVLKPGAYTLGTLSGEPIPRTQNAETLQKYYQ